MQILSECRTLPTAETGTQQPWPGYAAANLALLGIAAAAIGIFAFLAVPVFADRPLSFQNRPLGQQGYTIRADERRIARFFGRVEPLEWDPDAPNGVPGFGPMP
jgi:hypothetical protein